MSLFQCQNCGCAENTAVSLQGIGQFMAGDFNWKGKERLKGKTLCSACAPEYFIGGGKTGFGKWHNQFKQVFLPKGKFKTNKSGNLEHVENGDTDYRRYKLWHI